MIVTDLIAQSFIKIFNNAFLNTIEQAGGSRLYNDIHVQYAVLFCRLVDV